MYPSDWLKVVALRTLADLSVGQPFGYGHDDGHSAKPKIDSQGSSMSLPWRPLKKAPRGV